MSPTEALKQTFAFPTIRRSLVVALIVGTALNLINQGDALLGSTQPVIWKLILTYVVPFAVASYGSYAALRSTR
jgi:membrane protein CcdC involved in cytochrome C biogenesis